MRSNKTLPVNAKPLGCRQGDVLLKPVSPDRISGERVRPVDGHFVLAEGEHSGHLHMVEAIDGVDFVSDGISAFLTVQATTDDAKQTPKLMHQERVGNRWVQAEHNALPIAQSSFEVVQQRRVLPGFKHTVVRAYD